MDSSGPLSNSSEHNSPKPTTHKRISTASIPRRPAVDNPNRSSSDNVTQETLPTTPIPDEEHGADLPLTMSASVVLTALPRDAHQALADAEAIDTGKGNYERFGNGSLQSRYSEAM